MHDYRTWLHGGVAACQIWQGGRPSAACDHSAVSTGFALARSGLVGRITLKSPLHRKLTVGSACKGAGAILRFSIKNEASEARQAVGKRREGPLWASLGHVGNGFSLSTCPGLSIGTRAYHRRSNIELGKTPTRFKKTCLTLSR